MARNKQQDPLAIEGRSVEDVDDLGAALPAAPRVTASQLYYSRGEAKRALNQTCQDICSLIRYRGSRTALTVHRSFLTKQLETVQEYHSQYVAAIRLDAAEHDKQCDFIRELEERVLDVYQRIDSYLLSRKDEAASSVLSRAPSQSSAALRRQLQRAKQRQEEGRKERERLAALEDQQRKLAREIEEARIAIQEARQHRDIEERIVNVEVEHGDHEDLVDLQAESVAALSLKSNSSASSSTGPSTSGSERASRPQHHSTSKWQDKPQDLSFPASAANAWLMCNLLPKVDIQPFDGNLDYYPEWRLAFKDMVHDVIPSKAQRLAILRQLLTPDVKAHFTKFLHNSELYIQALEALDKRYGRPEIIVRHHLRALRDLPLINRDDDCSAIGRMVRSIQYAIQALEVGGHRDELKSGMALDIVLDKLPRSLRSRWGIKAVKMLPTRATLKDLVKWLDTYTIGELLYGRASHPSTTETSVNIDTRRKNEPRGKRDKQTRSVLATARTMDLSPATDSVDASEASGTTAATSHAAGPIPKKCFACSETHLIGSCLTFQALDPNARTHLTKLKGQCFRCLNGNHRSSECLSASVCKVSGCSGKHHTLLHGAKRIFPKKPVKSVTISEGSASISPPAPRVSATCGRRTCTTLLKIVPVRLRNPTSGKFLDTLGFLDAGSDVTLVDEEVVQALDLQGEEKVVRFGTFHGKDPEFVSKSIGISIESLDGSFRISLKDASSVPNLNIRPRSVDVEDLQRRWTHLACVHPATDGSGRVHVLIGADATLAHHEIDIRLPPSGVEAPSAIRTPFGWCYFGIVPGATRSSQRRCSFIDSSSNLEQLVTRFWEQESVGTTPPWSQTFSEDERRAIEIIDATTSFRDGHYHTGLPFKSPDISLPNNFAAAANRQRMQEARFSRDPAFAAKYEAAIDENVRLGFARKLSAKELTATSGGRVWYLIHHAVQNPNKPGSCRVVFDASARYEGVSLNDVILKGPNLLLDLVTVLIRFSQRPVPVCSDIQKMFPQVGVDAAHQSFQRFLWRKPGSNDPLHTYQMLVQVFGVVSSPFICTHILRRAAEDNREYYPDVADKVYTNFYVDNFLDSFDCTEDATKVCLRLASLLQRGGFHLYQWASSSREVLAAFPAKDRSQPDLNVEFDPLPTERTLGVLWMSEEDHWTFKIRTDAAGRTKRQILRVIASIYDPRGHLAPVVLLAKRIMQELWQSGVGWDDEIPTNIQEQFDRWSNNLKSLERIRIPRAFLRSPNVIDIQLHAFCDASEVGFGAVLYIRVTYTNHQVSVTFVVSKSRVAPLRAITIPRLELCAAVLSTRLVSEAMKALQIPINRIVRWSDSTTTLQWIYSERKFQPFVENRVAEIRNGSKIGEWRHVPGPENPADDCSRGILPARLTHDHRWFTGPGFLREAEESWPCHIKIEPPSKNDPEISLAKWIGHVGAEENSIKQFMDKHSRLNYVRRTLAYLLRFKHNCLANRRGSNRREGPLQVVELSEATNLCLLLSQKAAFHHELAALQKTEQLRNGSPLQKFTPFLDENGIMRVGGRIGSGDFNFDVKHPIILPNKDSMTAMIIISEHRSLQHPSTERLHANLCLNYRIVGARSAINRYVGRCFICRKRRASPSLPLMAALPRARLDVFAPPFTNTGIDYFGPLKVKQRRSQVKRWGVLFTCLTTRAVYLDVAHSLDTDSFINCFQRFVARNCRPSKVYSDNGTQLVKGESELREAIANFNQTRITHELAVQGTAWHFNPPAAPHFGGSWESLVKSAKRALYAIIDNKPMTDEMLLTFLAEVESLLNGRPLTHVSVDPRDPEPLTPNHFLRLQASPRTPFRVIPDSEIDGRRKWKAVQVMVNHFWSRWLREYLPCIIERRRWLVNRKNLCINDIVLIVDPHSERGTWPIGRIVETIPGADGVVRRARIKTPNGIYERPAAKLCLLESEVFD